MIQSAIQPCINSLAIIKIDQTDCSGCDRVFHFIAAAEKLKAEADTIDQEFLDSATGTKRKKELEDKAIDKALKVDDEDRKAYYEFQKEELKKGGANGDTTEPIL